MSNPKVQGYSYASMPPTDPPFGGSSAGGASTLPGLVHRLGRPPRNTRPDASSPRPRAHLGTAIAREAVRQGSPVSVKAVPGTDIVQVRIQGDRKVFDSVGMSGLNTDNGDKRLEYFAVPADKYTPYVAGGRNKQHAITMLSDTDRKRLLAPEQSLRSRLFRSSSPSRAAPTACASRSPATTAGYVAGSLRE